MHEKIYLLEILNYRMNHKPLCLCYGQKMSYNMWLICTLSVKNCNDCSKSTVSKRKHKSAGLSSSLNFFYLCIHTLCVHICNIFMILLLLVPGIQSLLVPGLVTIQTIKCHYSGACLPWSLLHHDSLVLIRYGCFISVDNGLPYLLDLCRRGTIIFRPKIKYKTLQIVLHHGIIRGCATVLF